MNNTPEDLTFSSLDPSQKNTFDEIIHSDDNLHVVYGPPGTGKSQLVVSLLEGLASREKKVLFVSQNTEALKVVERMILKTQRDISYPLDNKYMSLLDFCLMLYNPTHRQLKHLREQHSNLTSKQLATVDTATKPANADFNLRYTNLDRNANYSLEGSDVGFDELVSYFMRYVNQAIAPEPLRESEKIDVRGIFKALDEYQLKEHFSEYNHPKRELALLSTEKHEIALPDVRHDLRDIKDSIKGEWIHFFAAKEDIDVLDYLNHLKEYSSLKEFFDVYRLATENVNVSDLENSIKELIEKSERINAKILAIDQTYKNTVSTVPVRVHGITGTTERITINDATLKAIQDNLERAIADKDRIVLLIRDTIAKYPLVEYASVKDVWIGLGQGIAQFYHQSLDKAKATIGSKAIVPSLDSIADLSKLELEGINQDTHDFSEKIKSMGSLKRTFASVPDSIKKRFNVTLVSDFEKFRDSLSPLLVVLPTVMSDTNHVSDILAFSSKKAVPMGKLKITVPTSSDDLAAAFISLNELVELLARYDITADNYKQMKQDATMLDGSLTSLATILGVQDNRGLVINTPLKQVIESVNISVEAIGHLRSKQELDRQLHELWNEAYNASKSLIVGIESTDDLKHKAPMLYEYLTHKSDQIPKLLKAINVPDQNMPLDVDFEKIETILHSANATDNFSDEFFEIRASGTVKTWLDTIAVLEVYNNDLEIIEYTRHNTSIGDIKRSLGIANYAYVDDILSNDISFDVFAARIVNALVGEIFGRASVHQKATISTVDMIKAYDRYLKSQRSTLYRNTLRDLYNRTTVATKELSKQNTLQAAGSSTMEKFRHNTAIIAEAFPIICATPKDVAKYIAPSKALFDYVIFDEASQLLPGQSLPSIYRAHKTVIIGDPHQMPPNLNASFSLTEQSEDDFDDLGESILDLVLKQPQRQHHLKVHYRSKYNKLFEPSRKAIYSKYGVEPIFEAELADGAPIDILDDLGDDIDEHGYDKNFAKLCEEAEGYLSRDENADFCILFTTSDMLQKFKGYLEEVGSKEHKKVSDLYDNDKILLSTVTNCQGIEGTYTILYMHHYDRPGAMWFFKEQAGAYKRLNVSITRQREGLKLLLADPRSHWIAACDQKLNSAATGPNAQQSAELMKSLLTSAGEQADVTYLDRELGQNVSKFDSPLAEQLYNKLAEYYEDKLGRDLRLYSEVGWNLVIPKGEGIDANERNVGFRIDLGIYSLAKKRFVLGIEMDGAMYHSGYEKEHSDYTRQKVLEAKGWDIYRIWSTNWLMDMDKEFGKLTQKIDKAIATDV